MEGPEKPITPIEARHFPKSRELLLAALGNETAITSVGEFLADGTVVYGTSSSSTTGQRYQVSIDYAKFSNDSIADEHGEIEYRVGVGVRVRADFTATEAGVDIGSLVALAVAAHQKKISGQLRVDLIGISGPSVTPLVPLPATLDITSIQNAINTIGSVKAKLYDKEGVQLTPHVFFVDAPRHTRADARKLIEKRLAAKFQERQ